MLGEVLYAKSFKGEEIVQLIHIANGRAQYSWIFEEIK